jgi:hypothetical protein
VTTSAWREFKEALKQREIAMSEDLMNYSLLQKTDA